MNITRDDDHGEAAVVRMNTSQEGEMSYANNSSLQRAIASVTKKARQDMAAALYRARGRPASMTIADLGCATGPNALFMVTDAVEAVLAECRRDNDDLAAEPELQVFLNDLPANDFNAVFRLLPTSPLAAIATGPRCCFVSAWPGSFYGRIFPEASIDYAVSSCSLHFLSKPPDGVSNSKRGRVYISSSSWASESHVLDAYAAQFRSDFSAFLRCCTPPMRPGGLVLATLVARKTLCPTAHDCAISGT
jgi:jasmonate O-methyltransferase